MSATPATQETLRASLAAALPGNVIIDPRYLARHTAPSRDAYEAALWPWCESHRYYRQLWPYAIQEAWDAHIAATQAADLRRQTAAIPTTRSEPRTGGADPGDQRPAVRSLAEGEV